MADILHDFVIKAPPARVLEAVSLPAGLDCWWTKDSRGAAALGAAYQLGFGPGYDWRARVSCCTPETEFELEMTDADGDWVGTRVGFRLQWKGGETQVRFHHSGWREESEHFRISSYCWAMYLRLLRRYLEHGERVAYETRLDA